MFNNEQNNQNKQIEKIDEEPKTEENIEDEKKILEDMPNSEENNRKEDKGDKLFEGYNGNNCQLRSTNAQSTINNEEEQKDKEEENNSLLIKLVSGQDESQYQDLFYNNCKERKPDSPLKEFEQEQEINRESHPNENDEKKDENNGTIDNNNMEIDDESSIINNENINISNQNQKNEITINNEKENENSQNLNDINNTHDMVIDNENNNELINNINNRIGNLNLNENAKNENEDENANIQIPQINNIIQMPPNDNLFGEELNHSQDYDDSDERLNPNIVLPESNYPHNRIPFSLIQNGSEFHLGNEFQMIMEEDDFDNGINDNNNIGDDFFNSNLNTQDTEEHNNG